MPRNISPLGLVSPSFFGKSTACPVMQQRERATPFTRIGRRRDLHRLELGSFRFGGRRWSEVEKEVMMVVECEGCAGGVRWWWLTRRWFSASGGDDGLIDVRV
jgi:hypothetical protein